ncbi:MAG: putative small integral rane protein [Microvirga sp.]|jgi:low affinity Fe/Cu permease|nr:putative small integral rane protein [Microvirga sp.]
MGLPHGAPGVSSWFARFAEWCSDQVGAPWFFLTNVVLCVVGMAFPAGYDFFIALISVLTWLVAILIQTTQNRQERGLQAKLDELIRVNERARDSLIGIEKR